jgi:hypothetical protein
VRMDEAAVGKLFQRYERLFNQSLCGDDPDMDEVASLYASEFIGASGLCRLDSDLYSRG